MIYLEKSLRNELTRTVLAARKVAEGAAGKALHALGVDESDTPGHLDNEGRRLRIRLRAQARQLGDGENSERRGCNKLRHLTEKLAYDHWHRLLFARFLAENDLLISPEHGVGVSLSDCEELAPALGRRDGWEVAAQFAARMLPQIFRADDPAGNVIFAPEDRAALRKFVTDLPRDIFLADDALGWVYQFWQAQRKEEINKSGDKIGADEIAPVTQLFTEDYMVLFLLHNTLGAWHAAKVLAALPAEALEMADEARLRKACALPGVNWEYLRFVKDEKTGGWRPAAGNFTSWPKTAKELRLLDPCMGSGHFLAAELPMLVEMRMAEEGLTKEDAVVNVIQDNLFGLEIDPRCTQIAAFNLTLAAWKLIGQYRKLLQLNLACCGLGINARKDDWLNLAGDDARLCNGMEQLYDLFQKAPDLGSLINPHNIGDLHVAEFHELQPLAEHAMAREKTKRDDTLTEMGVTARGLARAAEILASQFTLVATNVPYLGMRKQDETLRDFCDQFHPDARADLATCFVERCLAFCDAGGSIALVTPQNWLFLTTYKGLRHGLLGRYQWDFVCKLGARSFQMIGGEVVKAVLIGLTSRQPAKRHAFAGLDVSNEAGPIEKAMSLVVSSIVLSNQQGQLEHPDSRIVIGGSQSETLLSDFSYSAQGIGTTDNPRFVHCFWEQKSISGEWESFQSSASNAKPIGGCSTVLRWGGPGSVYFTHIEELKKENRIGGGWQAGGIAWGRKGFAVNVTGTKFVTQFSQEKFDTTVGVIIPKDREYETAIICYLTSPDYTEDLKEIDPTLSVTEGTLIKVPFDLIYWKRLAEEKYPHGLPKHHSDDPTQWLFNGHPKSSTSQLQVAVARLLGYQWPRQTGLSFPDSPSIGLDGLEPFADADGIVCLNAITGEQPAAERLRALLAAAFGLDWSAEKQADLLAQADYGGKTLEEWLRNGFFEQHCQIFHQRPFVWQVWDGLSDGFSALVNYHSLDRHTLEKLTYTYLGDWVARQKAAVTVGEEGSDTKLAAAQELKASLEKILEGGPPYDIFVRWKPLEKQPIGWDPDLNDGVRLNIRPFVEAGILRRTPKINWNKDRGKDVRSAPWFKIFKGERINDHHLTLAEKRKARGI